MPPSDADSTFFMEQQLDCVSESHSGAKSVACWLLLCIVHLLKLNASLEALKSFSYRFRNPKFRVELIKCVVRIFMSLGRTVLHSEYSEIQFNSTLIPFILSTLSILGGFLTF